jgi:GTPase SAR1 family protein
MDAPYKVCVLGPSNAGKTLLCRALANQSSSIVDAKPTVPVR